MGDTMPDLRTIKMNYREAMRQADRLSFAADRMEREGVYRMGEVISRMRSDWKGENADMYLQKCVLMQEKTKKTVKKVRDAAGAIREIAQNTYDTEMHNHEVARRRSY